MLVALLPTAAASEKIMSITEEVFAKTMLQTLDLDLPLDRREGETIDYYQDVRCRGLFQFIDNSIRDQPDYDDGFQRAGAEFHVAAMNRLRARDILETSSEMLATNGATEIRTRTNEEYHEVVVARVNEQIERYAKYVEEEPTGAGFWDDPTIKRDIQTCFDRVREVKELNDKFR